MDDQNLSPGVIEEASRPAGGTQNLLLKFPRVDRWFMLRRPPLHPRMNGSETMRREARVLAALAGTDVPHPRLIAACSREDVLGAAFYLMEPVDGFNPTVGLPPLHVGDPAVRRDMGFALVERYAGQTDRDMAHMSWYAVLACYKLGIILEGAHARAAAGKAEKATGDALHAQTLSLFQRALAWID